ncbi:MAG: DUF1801 domain-containing protein [Bacteroidetes bacterium]|nr:MAG: DUF1801 domain-containing protein [Bacteroidota bacterium]
MAELKTKKNKESVLAFLNAVEPETVRNDCLQLKKLFESVTKKKAAMWGTSIVGFGMYHYKSERSTQEGDWPLTGFSPRKQNITLYIMPGTKKYAALLKQLGKHKTSAGSCIYIKKLADIDTKILEELITASVADMKKAYNVK